jgi:hypothetical protein
MEHHDGKEVLPRPPVAVLDVEPDDLKRLVHIQELPFLDRDPGPRVIDVEQGLQVVVPREFSAIFPAKHRVHLDDPTVSANALRARKGICQVTRRKPCPCLTSVAATHATGLNQESTASSI